MGRNTDEQVPYQVAVRNISGKAHFATLVVDGQQVSLSLAITQKGEPRYSKEGDTSLLFALARSKS